MGSIRARTLKILPTPNLWMVVYSKYLYLLPLFGYRCFLKSPNCDRHFLEQVTTPQVIRLFRGRLRICFRRGGLFLKRRELLWKLEMPCWSSFGLYLCAKNTNQVKSFFLLWSNAAIQPLGGVCIAVRQLNLTPKPAFKAMTSVLKQLEWTQRITHFSLKWYKSQLPFKSVFVLYLGGLSPLQQGWERVRFTTVRFGWGHPHHRPQALIQTLIIHCLNVHQERTILSPCHAYKGERKENVWCIFKPVKYCMQFCTGFFVCFVFC